MKTSEYVKKYKLNENNSFNHAEFATDFTIDFISLVEWNKLKSNFTHAVFQTVVKQIRQKWDSISNKTAGELPEKLWRYIYSAVISKAEDELFPEVVKLRMQILGFNNSDLVEFIRERGIYVWSFGIGLFSDRKASEAMEQAEKSGNPALLFAVREYERRGKIRSQREEEKRKRDQERWYREYQERRQRQQEAYDWFNSFFSSFKVINKPDLSFNVLGLQETATLDEVKKAYRQLSMKHHPDKGGDQTKFIEITEAKNKCLAYLGVS